MPSHAVDVVLVNVVVEEMVAVVVLVTVDVHSSPHIAGHCASANSWCTPPMLQSAAGIRDPHPATSGTPLQNCGW